MEAAAKSIKQLLTIATVLKRRQQHVLLNRNRRRRRFQKPICIQKQTVAAF